MKSKGRKGRKGQERGRKKTQGIKKKEDENKQGRSILQKVRLDGKGEMTAHVKWGTLKTLCLHTCVRVDSAWLLGIWHLSVAGLCISHFSNHCTMQP